MGEWKVALPIRLCSQGKNDLTLDPANTRHGSVQALRIRYCYDCPTVNCATGQYYSRTALPSGGCQDIANVVCGSNQFWVGSNPGKCQACSNIKCPSTQRQIGSCSGTNNGFQCKDVPTIETTHVPSTLPPTLLTQKTTRQQPSRNLSQPSALANGTNSSTGYAAFGQTITHYINQNGAASGFEMCVVPAPWALGPKHSSNPA